MVGGAAARSCAAKAAWDELTGLSETRSVDAAPALRGEGEDSCATMPRTSLREALRPSSERSTLLVSRSEKESGAGGGGAAMALKGAVCAHTCKQAVAAPRPRF